jgi:hypothetical protein
MKKYELTPEHKEQLKPWADKWIANNMSTKPMDEADKEAMRVAVTGLYRAANLKPPPPERIVFAPSPFVARFAAGFAAAIWYLRKNGSSIGRAATWAATEDATRAATEAATRAATRAATGAATWAATGAATRDATWAATRAATEDATRDATWAATEDATEDATRAATWAATEAATWAATRDATWAATEDATEAATRAATEDATRAATEDATEAATRAATEDATEDATRAATWAATRAATWAATEAAPKRSWFSFSISAMVSLSAKLRIGKLGLECAYHADRMMTYGNQYSAYTAFLSFFRHVARLPLDYSKFDHWEKATIHGGVRFMHEKFCIISDRPEVLLVDSENRPHCDNGPFCRYRDGTALYAIHGTRVPAELVETPADKLDVKEWLKEENVDWRRIAFEKIGLDRVAKDLGAVVVDHYECPVGGQYDLLEIDVGVEEKKKVLSMLNPSIKAKHFEGVPPTTKTVKEAICFRNGLKEFHAPAHLS